ncbi:MAG: hypothetical protein H6720_08830 [Sandaracinus sp.]|nr:hypothetical protein [Sandaracinus sp.]
MLGWHEDVLYVAVEVKDDVHAPSDDRDTLWTGDSLQLALDPTRAYGDAYDADDHELDFAGLPGGPVVHRNHGRTNDDGIRIGVTALEGTTRYELALPFAAIGLEGPGARAGFSFVVNDRDAASRRGWLALTPGLAETKAPYWYAELEVLAEPVEVDGGGTVRDASVATRDAAFSGDDEGSGGCSCAASDSPIGAPAWGLFWLVARARRRSLER